MTMHGLRVALATGVLLLVASGSGRAIPSQQASPRTRIDEAATLLMAQKTRDALTLLQPLTEDRAVAADPALNALLLFHTGWAYFQSNDYARALDFYTRARTASQAAGDGATEARSVFGIAQTHKNRGEYQQAAAISEDARRLYETLKDDQGMARSWQLLGSIQDLTGRHREALESYHHARRFYGSAKSQAAFRLFNEIAITHKNLGNYQEAVDLYKEGFQRLSEINDRYGQAMVMANLATVHSLLGQPELAIEGFQQSLTLARSINERRGESMLLGDLGEMFLERGDFARASDYLQQQLRLTRELGNRNEEANSRSAIGELHRRKGDLLLARESYENAMKIQREIGAQARLGSTLLALADLSLKTGNRADAEQQAAEALALARKTDTPELEWKARLAVGQRLAAEGRTSGAIDELRASAAIINNLRANVASDSGKIGFVDERQEVFEALAATLVADGRTVEALEAAEAGRARAFADLLEQRQVRAKATGQPTLAAVRTAIDDAREGRVAVEQEPAAASGDVTRSGGALEASLARLRTEDRELASLITAESPTRAEIGEIAARLNTTFVEYLATERRLFSWMVLPDGTIQSASADIRRVDLEALVAGLRTAVDATPVTAADRTAIRSKLRSLHQSLIDPLARWLPASAERNVVIVPHGPLALVPFAALEDTAGRPLVERHTLAFAPSIGVFRYTPAKRHDRSGQPSALVVADARAPASAGMPALPGALEEGRQVASRLGQTGVVLLTGARATEAAVKREAQHHRVLHFATHGLVSAEYPLASSLLLAAGDREDGYLRADEIFSLSLNADLVVLSGCSTGLGKLSGDGIIGLGRAFIYAGTPSVVASQWDVSDRATVHLMNAFYTGIRDQLGPAAALRRAQVETRKRFPDPALWAAFLVVGEP